MIYGQVDENRLNEAIADKWYPIVVNEEGEHSLADLDELQISADHGFKPIITTEVECHGR